MKQYRDMKFAVNNEEHSKEVQKALFDLGYKWQAGACVFNHTTAKYLYANNGGYLSYGSMMDIFHGSTHKSQDVSWMDPLKVEVVEYDGRMYIKADFEKAISDLVEAC